MRLNKIKKNYGNIYFNITLYSNKRDWYVLVFDCLILCSHIKLCIYFSILSIRFKKIIHLWELDNIPEKEGNFFTSSRNPSASHKVKQKWFLHTRSCVPCIRLHEQRPFFTNTKCFSFRCNIKDLKRNAWSRSFFISRSQNDLERYWS